MLADVLQGVPQAALEGTQDGELLWSAVLAWMTSKAVEMAKVRGWLKWAHAHNFDTETIHRAISWAAAFAVTLGLAYGYNEATGDWFIRGNVHTMLEGVGHFARQLMFQQIAYKQFVRVDTERKMRETGAHSIEELTGGKPGS